MLKTSKNIITLFLFISFLNTVQYSNFLHWAYLPWTDSYKHVRWILPKIICIRLIEIELSSTWVMSPSPSTSIASIMSSVQSRSSSWLTSTLNDKKIYERRRPKRNSNPGHCKESADHLLDFSRIDGASSVSVKYVEDPFELVLRGV